MTNNTNNSIEQNAQWGTIAERIRFTCLYMENVLDDPNEAIDDCQRSVFRAGNRLLRKIAQDVHDMAQGKEIHQQSIDTLPAGKGYEKELEKESRNNYNQWLDDSYVLYIGPKVLE